MNKNRTARDFVIDIASRSPCRIRVAAVLSDNHGIFSWGWNHPAPDGSGVHAEEHAISRANRRRLKGSRLTVFGARRKNEAPVTARPCKDFCLLLALKYGIAVIEYGTKSGTWIVEKLGYVRAR
ncbi:MAG: hypothetical protein A2939_05065 [Parcubacteria group bacterium RIFCSPLOWO2_01_FULL_48_18]|nr:MAG: hypothetical protein A3J67_03460 [Parcubacteria group bacterium RIFCSPHIGHO2_02_FULL_48_10b]OHB22238.1 MAG: hypothetical protein A2939_05065 [Parcubacteria group bacterium RIFCSPLOWO2_01_FULL_48_18]